MEVALPQLPALGQALALLLPPALVGLSSVTLSCAGVAVVPLSPLLLQIPNLLVGIRSQQAPMGRLDRQLACCRSGRSCRCPATWWLSCFCTFAVLA